MEAGPSRPRPPVVQPGLQAPSKEADRAPVVRPASGSSVLVNTCQKGNPMLSHVRNVAWEYGDILADYQVGATSGILYLSLRYHRLHPEYVHGRISKLGQAYQLRILLILCDVDDHQDVIKELTKVAIVNNMTTMIAWSNQEAGRYVEIYKSFERKGPSLIQERVEKDYMSQLTAVLTGVRGVNKTDVLSLASNFGSVKRVVEAPADELGMCPGLGEKKTRRLRAAFTDPFFIVPGRESEAAKRARTGPALN